MSVPRGLGRIEGLEELDLREIDQPIRYVYFLAKQGNIVYVGTTANPHTRARGHKKDKDFDRMFFLKVEEKVHNEAEEIEARFILKHKPKYNRQSKRALLTRIATITYEKELISHLSKKEAYV